VNQLRRADRTNESYEASPAKTGVDLTVTAKHVGAEYVTIELWPKVDGLAGFASRIGGTLSPIQTRREAKTTVTLRDEETLVLGGLYTNRVVREEAKTPLLSDVPVIGTMFTRQREAKQKSELVFLLKPKIIRKASNPRVITPPAELKRLERGGDLDDPPPCGPCKPNPDIQDLLFPREAACRDLQERRAAAAAAEAQRDAAAESAAAAKAAAAPGGLPPPPSPPPPSTPGR
jgi:type II secretory pathway component GspD/PulD (secretin)